MGSASRRKPARLAGKLLEIRQKLDLSQNGMARMLNLEQPPGQERISKYERGVLEPPLHVLCAYAEVANIYLEVLAKDELDLPTGIPSKKKSEGVERLASPRDLKRN